MKYAFAVLKVIGTTVTISLVFVLLHVCFNWDPVTWTINAIENRTQAKDSRYAKDVGMETAPNSESVNGVLQETDSESGTETEYVAPILLGLDGDTSQYDLLDSALKNARKAWQDFEEIDWKNAHNICSKRDLVINRFYSRCFRVKQFSSNKFEGVRINAAFLNKTKYPIVAVATELVIRDKLGEKVGHATIKIIKPVNSQGQTTFIVGDMEVDSPTIWQYNQNQLEFYFRAPRDLKGAFLGARTNLNKPMIRFADGTTIRDISPPSKMTGSEYRSMENEIRHLKL
jgi:hypothetical protein